MRFAFALATLGAAQITPVRESFSQFGDSCLGGIYGFFEHQMPNVLACVNQSEGVVQSFEDVFAQFSMGGTDGVGNGFITLGNTIKAFPKTLG